MNTASSAIPILPEVGDYVYALEDLEPAYPKWQMAQITHAFNNGDNIPTIADREQREDDEIFLAIYHQARKGRITRRFISRSIL
ncbi:MULTISPECIES: hypothetical protein [unclassified Oceanobacillus]|uniref:hypothetical protein n=1 Tax=unclassified Oceanobacillus TaxID=2630292 RepID=UPI001BE934FA|nr:MULTISPECIES: hypothetical protein [unclassified Oceanobacillus]MBT2601265.1 hypothetical protein [Oceanobacillus sp. ISL-74]MBT2653629.1 hypothetical protein [Oceanobacillus sp. ISL-73]